MDEIEQRLRESSESCITNYTTWRGKEGDTSAREALMEAIHDLRKVASRLEIEMAISERQEMAGKPIPIPPHRSSRKGQQQGNNDFDQDDGRGNSAGAANAPSQNKGPRRSGGGRGRRPAARQAE